MHLRPWTLIVPVKDTRRGKSRLLLPAEHHQAVALAMAVDTISAAAMVAEVLAVVESDADANVLAETPRVATCLTSVRGLNEAIQQGLATGSGPLVAVLPGDLPGLSPVDLAAALDVAERHPLSVVADWQGSGTTLLAASARHRLIPQYGPGSFARHVASGAFAIEQPTTSTLRGDIDVFADLRGRLGPRTELALQAAGITVPGLADRDIRTA